MALQPLSHSVTQSGWVAEWLSGCVSRSARVAEWLVAAPANLPQPLSHSAREAGPATQPLCQRGWTSHSATLAERLTQPLSHSASDWVAGPATLAEWLSGWSSLSGRVAEWLLRFREPCCTSTHGPWKITMIYITMKTHHEKTPSYSINLHWTTIKPWNHFENHDKHHKII